MDDIRRARVESELIRALTEILRDQIRDPRIPLLSLLRAEISPDTKNATVYFSISIMNSGMDVASPAMQESVLKALESASGFMRREISKMLKLRNAPYLVFKIDRGFENITRVGEILSKLHNKSNPDQV